jgi:hypothetical protein
VFPTYIVIVIVLWYSCSIFIHFFVYFVLLMVYCCLLCVMCFFCLFCLYSMCVLLYINGLWICEMYRPVCMYVFRSNATVLVVCVAMLRDRAVPSDVHVKLLQCN